MEAGVSTACLYPKYVEEALLDLVSRNVKLVEIFINSDCELKKDFVLEMRRTVDEYGAKVASLHPFTCGIEPMMFFTKYERRYIDILDYYKRYFEVMNILGANIFIFHGNKDTNYFQNEAYFERFAGLSKVGKEFGITVAQENVSRCVSGKIAFLKEMSAYLGDVASFVLDTKQAERSGEDVFEYLSELKGKIAHVHFSETGEKGDCLPYGEGDFKSNLFFKTLKNQDFSGNIILELYAGSYRDSDALAANYFKLKGAVGKI